MEAFLCQKLSNSIPLIVRIAVRGLDHEQCSLRMYFVENRHGDDTLPQSKVLFLTPLMMKPSKLYQRKALPRRSPDEVI